jgi:hypothetical protein
VLLAHGVLLAGLIADRIFFHAARLLDFKAELAMVTSGLSGCSSTSSGGAD